MPNPAPRAERRRIAVTGLGCITPIGNDVASAWANALAGKSGIGPITKFDASAFSCRFAGEVKGFDYTSVINEKEGRHMDAFVHFGMAAADEALRDAGLAAQGALSEEQSERAGCVLSSGMGGLPMIEAGHKEYLERGPRRISPFFIPSAIINMISGHVSIRHGFKGPNLAMATACTTGVHSIGLAARLIQCGDADVMVAGGAEAAISPLGLGGFASARALSTRNDDPATASRPWDKGRDGFVLGEGAGALVLEEMESAKARGARIYAELVGFGASGDAFHITAPNIDGPRRAMRAALQDAGLNPEAIQHLNAHGTSTPLGDVNETRAIRAAFGDAADRIAVTSTKSMTGHLLGGAGGVESVFTVLALHHQVCPPSINLFERDPECDLDYCANQPREMKMDAVMKNNFGFGGTNGTLIFQRLP